MNVYGKKKLKKACTKCAKKKAGVAYHHSHHKDCAHSAVHGKTHGEVNERERQRVDAKALRLSKSKMQKRPGPHGPLLEARGALDAAVSVAAAAAAPSPAAVAAAAVAVPPRSVAAAAAAPSSTGAPQLIAGVVIDATPPSAKFPSLLPCVKDALLRFVGEQPSVNFEGKILGSSEDLAAFRGRATLMPMHVVAKDINMLSCTQPNIDDHVMRGQVMMCIRWEYLGLVMMCPSESCDCVLHGNTRGKQNAHWLTSTGTFRLMFHTSGRPMIIVPWIYAPCTGCGTTWSSVHRSIIAQLQPRIQRSLPFAAAWVRSNGALLYSREFTDEFVSSVVTYDSMEHFVKKAEQRLALQHDRARMDYHGHIAAFNATFADAQNMHFPPFPQFPPFALWVGRSDGMPGAKVVSNMLQECFYAEDAVRIDGESMSMNVALRRNMQRGSASGISMSGDHTHAVAKNVNDPDVKQMYDMVSSRLTVMACGFTGRTSMNEIIHMIESLIHRPDFSPSVYYLDTWPNDKAIWEALLPYSKGRLPIWHMLHRINETLVKKHSRFGQACGELSRGVWDFDSKSITAVDCALLDAGTFGVRHGFGAAVPRDTKTALIATLKSSGRYFKIFASYLAKTTFPRAKLVVNFKNWCTKYGSDYDTSKATHLFTSSTVKTLNLQLAIVDDWEDLDRKPILLRKKKVEHNMREVLQDGGEKCECFHASVGAYANINSNPKTAHALTSIGTANWNDAAEHKVWFHDGMIEDEVPLHQNVILRFEANDTARAAQMRLPYPLLPRSLPNTGEKFGYDYHVENRARILDFPFVKGMTHCPCVECTDRRKHCLCPSCCLSRGEDDAEGKMAQRLVSCSGDAKWTVPQKKVIQHSAKLVRAGRALFAIAHAARASIDLIPLLSSTVSASASSSSSASKSASASGGAGNAHSVGDARYARGDAGKYVANQITVTFRANPSHTYSLPLTFLSP